MSTNTNITVGSEEKIVNISNSLANGYNCFVNDGEYYSHAEGFESSATGYYSHADGYKAYAYSDRTYVWNGQTDENSDNGIGTYNIYVRKDNENAPLSNIYLNGKTLYSYFEDYRDKFDKSIILKSDNTWNSQNTFTNGFYVNGTTVLASIATITFDNTTSASLNGSLLVKTQSVDHSPDNTIANVEYVHNAIAKSALDGGGYVTVNTDSSVGGTLRPVYIDKSGVVQSFSSNALFAGTKNGDNLSISYVNGSSICISDANIGNSTNTVFIESGSLKASSLSLGSSVNFVYLDEGQFTKSDLTTGSNLNFIYVEKGKIRTLPSNLNYGDRNTPVYLNNGSLCLCTRRIPSVVTLQYPQISNVISNVSEAVPCKYIRQLKAATTSGGTVTLDCELKSITANDIDGFDSPVGTISQNLDRTIKRIQDIGTTVQYSGTGKFITDVSANTYLKESGTSIYTASIGVSRSSLQLIDIYQTNSINLDNSESSLKKQYSSLAAYASLLFTKESKELEKITGFTFTPTGGGTFASSISGVSISKNDSTGNDTVNVTYTTTNKSFASYPVSDFLCIETNSFSYTLSKNEVTSCRIDITKSGYVPIAVLNIKLNRKKSGGTTDLMRFVYLHGYCFSNFKEGDELSVDGNVLWSSTLGTYLYLSYVNRNTEEDICVKVTVDILYHKIYIIS